MTLSNIACVIFWVNGALRMARFMYCILKHFAHLLWNLSRMNYAAIRPPWFDCPHLPKGSRLMRMDDDGAASLWEDTWLSLRLFTLWCCLCHRVTADVSFTLHEEKVNDIQVKLDVLMYCEPIVIMDYKRHQRNERIFPPYFEAVLTLATRGQKPQWSGNETQKKTSYQVFFSVFVF